LLRSRILDGGFAGKPAIMSGSASVAVDVAARDGSSEDLPLLAAGVTNT